MKNISGKVTNLTVIYDILVDNEYWATLKTQKELPQQKLFEIACCRYPKLLQIKDKDIYIAKSGSYFT